jgi:hypothetical protein
MVSWFHLFDIRWSSYEEQLKPNGTLDAIHIHEGFNVVRNPPDGDYADRFKMWWDIAKISPGVLMVGRGKKNDSDKGLIHMIHHLKEIKVGQDVVIIGLDSLSEAAPMAGVYLDELYSDLGTAKKTRSAAMKDRFIPTIEGLIDDRHPVTGKFVPGVLDNCEQVDALCDMPNAMFVPFPLIYLMYSAQEAAGDEDEESILIGAAPIHPRSLLLRLVAGMKGRKEHDTKWYKEWRGVAQNLVTFLWAKLHDMSAGNTIVTLHGN